MSKIGWFFCGVQQGSRFTLVGDGPFSEGTTHQVVSQYEWRKSELNMAMPFRLWKATIVEDQPASIDAQLNLVVAKNVYNVDGLLVAREGGIHFVADDGKAYPIDRDRAVLLFNNLLMPLGYSFETRNKFVLSATATIVEDRVILREVRAFKEQK